MVLRTGRPPYPMADFRTIIAQEPWSLKRHDAPPVFLGDHNHNGTFRKVRAGETGGWDSVKRRFHVSVIADSMSGLDRSPPELAHGARLMTGSLSWCSWSTGQTFFGPSRVKQ